MKISNLKKKLLWSVGFLGMSLQALPLITTQNSKISFERKTFKTSFERPLVKQGLLNSTSSVVPIVKIVFNIVYSATRGSAFTARNINIGKDQRWREKQLEKFNQSFEEMKNYGKKDQETLREIDKKLEKTNQILEENNQLLGELIELFKEDEDFDF